jgi:predicted metal-dependent phosphoesterase TrpH
LEKRIKGLARSIRKDQIEQTHQRTKRKINKKYTTKEGKKYEKLEFWENWKSF